MSLFTPLIYYFLNTDIYFQAVSLITVDQGHDKTGDLSGIDR